MLNHKRVDASWFTRPAAHAILTEAETDYRERRTFVRPTRYDTGYFDSPRAREERRTESNNARVT